MTPEQAVETLRSVAESLDAEHLVGSASDVREAADVLADALPERDGYKARFDSYEPGTMEGQVRAIWDLAEFYGHPAFSSKHPVGFLQRYIEGVVAERDKLRAALKTIGIVSPGHTKFTLRQIARAALAQTKEEG